MQIVQFVDKTNSTHQNCDPSDTDSLSHPTHYQPWIVLLLMTLLKYCMVPLKFGKIDNQPKIHQIFTIQIFTH